MRFVTVLAIALPLSAQSSGGIPGVVAAGIQPELVQEGFGFTEGPVGMPDGGLFSDMCEAMKSFQGIVWLRFGAGPRP